MIRLEPQGNRMQIRLEPMADKIKNIFLPDDHREPSRISEVKAIGTKMTKVKRWWQFWKKRKYKYEVGDKVLVSFYTGVPIFLPQYDLDPVRDKIATEDEILALAFEEGEAVENQE